MLHRYRQLYSQNQNRSMYNDFTENVKTRFDTSKYELEDQTHIAIQYMMLIKKAKGPEKCVIKQILNF